MSAVGGVARAIDGKVVGVAESGTRDDGKPVAELEWVGQLLPSVEAGKADATEDTVEFINPWVAGIDGGEGFEFGLELRFFDGGDLFVIKTEEGLAFVGEGEAEDRAACLVEGELGEAGVALSKIVDAETGPKGDEAVVTLVSEGDDVVWVGIDAKVGGFEVLQELKVTEVGEVGVEVGGSSVEPIELEAVAKLDAEAIFVEVVARLAVSRDGGVLVVDVVELEPAEAGIVI